MANTPKSKSSVDKKLSKKDDANIKLRPDGWERFEHAVDAAIKSGPKHRAKKKHRDKKKLTK